MTDPPGTADLLFRERKPAGEPAGLLVLHHGRGTSEEDLLPLADVLDPGRRLVVVAPRAPLQPPGSSGYFWYLVPRVGHPDPASFHATFEQLATLHDKLAEHTGCGPERTILGGFSMGTVMSYALGLSEHRPAPAGILAFSGFVPTVEGWRPHLADRTETKVLIAHGQHDPVIDVGYARSARQLLEDGGLEVDYRESEQAAHNIDPVDIRRATRWIERVLPTSA
jgi:phospholipase/carboxylesterase